jgi:leader peptidase (prepilin peptidase)/N-methyltransferase
MNGMEGVMGNLLLAESTKLWVLQHVPSMLFVFAFGACVGSFLNVVMYRLPAGMSVISPPSRCPTCGARLKFFGENLPIIGWFMIRGKCRYCKAPVSVQYMVVELIIALLFLGLYVLLFVFRPNGEWISEIGGAWWYANNFFRAWPAYFLLAGLIAGLVAMTVIDARTFTIPIQIPVFVTVAAFILWPLQAWLPRHARTLDLWPIPGVPWPAVISGALGLAGVLLGVFLLKTGRLRYSFADYDEYVKDDEAIADYPHARREMLRELLFLLPIIAGLVVGWVIGGAIDGVPPAWLQALGGSVIGYFSGCACIWGIRILGTFLFGKEAMGLGDVHLLGAVGAVLGWFDPILIFFIAPFSGLLWTLLSVAVGQLLKKEGSALPYGPHLAVATVVLILCRPGIERLWTAYFPPTMPIPARALVVEDGKDASPPQPTPAPVRSAAVRW